MQRKQIRAWGGAVALALALAVGIGAAPSAVAAAPGAAGGAAQEAAAWVLTQQQPDGSFPGFGVGSTADGVLALVAGNPPGVGAAESKALDYLAGQAGKYATTPGTAAKLWLALEAAPGATQDPHAFGGVDLPGVISAGYDATTGHYGKDVTGQALAILALAGAHAPVPPAAAAWLVSVQGPEGGWAFDGSTAAGAADTNTTAVVLQALAAAGQPGAPAGKAVAYLHGEQNPDGGFAYQQAAGTPSDANSTAAVILGLWAAGEDPTSAAWQQGGTTPVAFLQSLQNADGALRYQAAQPADNAGATYQAVLALPGAAAVYATTPAPAGGTAGMPRTGAAEEPAGLLLIAGLAAVLLSAGLVVRRARPAGR